MQIVFFAGLTISLLLVVSNLLPELNWR